MTNILWWFPNAKFGPAGVWECGNFAAELVNQKDHNLTNPKHPATSTNITIVHIQSLQCQFSLFCVLFGYFISSFDVEEWKFETNAVFTITYIDSIHIPLFCPSPCFLLIEFRLPRECGIYGCILTAEMMGRLYFSRGDATRKIKTSRVVFYGTLSGPAKFSRRSQNTVP